MWKPSQHSARGAPAAYRAAQVEHPTVTATFCHATYLINLAHPDPALGKVPSEPDRQPGDGRRPWAQTGWSSTSAATAGRLRRRAARGGRGAGRGARRGRRRAPTSLPDPPREHRRCRRHRRPLLRGAGPGHRCGRRRRAARGVPRHPAPLGVGHPVRDGRGGRRPGPAGRPTRSGWAGCGASTSTTRRWPSGPTATGTRTSGRGPSAPTGSPPCSATRRSRDVPAILEVPGDGDGPRAEDVDAARSGRQVCDSGVALGAVDVRP